MAKDDTRANAEQNRGKNNDAPQTEPHKVQPAEDWGQRVTEGDVVASGGKSGGQSPNEQAHKQAEG